MTIFSFLEFEGMLRIKEVLETHQWASPSNEDDVNDPLLDDDILNDLEGEDGFRIEANELEREMMGLRLAIQNGGGDPPTSSDDKNHQDSELEVEELEALMTRMRAIRGTS